MKKIIYFFFLFSIFTFEIFSQKNISFRSHLSYPNSLDSANRLSNIWGYAANGKEYALVGTNLGLSIVDVTDPDTCIALFTVRAATSIWREIRTHGTFAYVTTEGGSGVTIVDLSNLPFSIKDTIWKGNGMVENQIDKIHALHIEDGFLYLYGGNYKNGGMVIADLSNPWSPDYVGEFEQYYVHDGCVRGNIAFPGNIFSGFFSVVDISNKSNPMLLATQNTPDNFTHNTWLSDDSKTLFTTDEKPDAYITAYDVSDFSDIKEISRYRHISDSGAIPHNTYVLNDFLITSYYTEGVTIVDAHKPDTLIEVGHYDTSPFSGNGYHGAWGVYPFLPSGNFLISDIEGGLFVLTPEYVRWDIEDLSFNPYLFPNPFSSETKITYALSSNSNVSIRIYNVLGEKIMDIIADEKQNYGKHQLSVNLKNLNSGIYFLAISIDKIKMQTIKAVKY